MAAERGERGERGYNGTNGKNATPSMEDHDLLVRIDERLGKALETIEKHDARICSLESSFWKVTGMAAVVGFVSGWFSKILGGN